ncbi:MAG: sugar ABC transporter ATP-binding protein, partial [Marivivens sp.]|nr:sugar ABC transporter ATP-binding protein [Marivivens sp.]
VRLHGKEVSFGSAGQAVRNRVGLLPEDRKHQGVLLDLSIRENALMTPVNPFISTLGWIDKSGERRKVEELWEGLRLKASNQSAPVSSLSGGNQQKVALMKWLVANCDVLFLDEPTRGVDVGAKVEIYRVINELAERGVAIVIVSSEMIELIGMCDRVAVMRAGRVIGTLQGTDMTENNIIELAMGRDNVH